MIDYYSKYVEIAQLSHDFSSSEAIKHLKCFMARHGIPQDVISDNGTQFSSTKFETFSKTWEFNRNTSSLNLSSRDGKVERAMQTVKISASGFINFTRQRLSIVNIRQLLGKLKSKLVSQFRNFQL